MTAYQILQATLRSTPKTWLVTGSAGFIGSNLVETLLRLDQRVVGLDNFATGYRKNLDQVQAKVTPAQWQCFQFKEGDIRNAAACQDACLGVDYVLHQGALGSVPRSIAEPLVSHDANVTGTLNMLLAARDQRVRRVVFASSSSIYGDHPGLPKVEDKIGTPLSPYAATKWMDEIYAGVCALNYGLETVGLRYFNVFGQRQDPDGAYAAVIPKWIATMLKGEDVFINGDGETSRDFCYIANVVQANLLAATAANPDAVNQAYNVAVGERTTLNQLFHYLREKLQHARPGLKIADPVYREFRDGDVRHSLADISKAQTRLGYVPTHSLSAGLDEALAWYQLNVG
ncbi:MAG: SDR family oxidoreductase [Verrucomicrobiota bacterium]